MRVVLFILCILTFLFAFGLLVGAKTSIHEIQAFILFTVAAVLLVGAGIINAIAALAKDLSQGKVAEPSPPSEGKPASRESNWPR